MAIYRGFGGVNREIREQHRGLGGVNRQIKEQYRGLSGVNRLVFGGGKFETDFSSKGEDWIETGGVFSYGANGLTITDSEAKGTVSLDDLGLSTAGTWVCKYLKIPFAKTLTDFELEYEAYLYGSSANRVGRYTTAICQGNVPRFWTNYTDAWAASTNIRITANNSLEASLYSETDAAGNGQTRRIKNVISGGRLAAYRDDVQIAADIVVPNSIEIDNIKIVIAAAATTEPLPSGRLTYLRIEEL
jgi:hypothetical protein